MAVDVKEDVAVVAVRLWRYERILPFFALETFGHGSLLICKCRTPQAMACKIT